MVGCIVCVCMLHASGFYPLNLGIKIVCNFSPLLGSGASPQFQAHVSLTL